MKRVPKILLVIVSCADVREAEKIAKSVVSKRLAACANVLAGATSFFKWKGQFAKAKELILLLKTTDKAYPALEKAIKSMHSYENPEVIALEVTRGSKSYLKWVAENCT